MVIFHSYVSLPEGTPHMVLLMGKMMINHDQPMELEASYQTAT